VKEQGGAFQPLIGRNGEAVPLLLVTLLPALERSRADTLQRSPTRIWSWLELFSGKIFKLLEVVPNALESGGLLLKPQTCAWQDGGVLLGRVPESSLEERGRAQGNLPEGLIGPPARPSIPEGLLALPRSCCPPFLK
jgi:hypothetical protein